MAHTVATPITLHAEQEHSGLRAVVVLAMAVSYIICFWLINRVSQLFPERIASLGFMLACLLAIPLAIGITWFLERWLKQVWHSGFKLSLENENFSVSQPESEEIDLDLSANFSNLNWFFKLSGYKRGGRERRVSDKWLCFCCQVQQDNKRIIVYAFAPPDKTAVYQNDHPLHFTKINPANIYGDHYKTRLSPPSRPNKLPTEVISGKNGRYWLAEQRRWVEGLELTFEDFETFLNYLQTYSL